MRCCPLLTDDGGAGGQAAEDAADHVFGGRQLALLVSAVTRLHQVRPPRGSHSGGSRVVLEAMVVVEVGVG